MIATVVPPPEKSNPFPWQAAARIPPMPPAWLLNVNSARRSRAQIEALKHAIYAELMHDHPQTCRGLFYRLVSAGVIEKTENAYQGIVVRLSAQMRRVGDLPYAWIADGTRWMRKPRTWTGLRRALENTRDTYRRALWENQPNYCEVWCEKDAVTGILVGVTASWDVPLMVCRGYPSLTFLHSAAENIRDVGKPTIIYYFGDHDPSGADIYRMVRDELARMVGPEVEIDFERVAVLPWQVEAFGLLTRPTKKSDSRSRNFTGESVEVDAIPARELKRICNQKIEALIDAEELARLRIIEQAERATLAGFIDGWRGA